MLHEENLAHIRNKTSIKTKRYVNGAIKLFQQLPKYHPCKKGRFEILEQVVPAGEKIPVISMRQALFEGTKLQPISIHTNEELKFYKLKDSENGTWMTTYLQELGQMQTVLKQARGDVLVGGLGLGVISHLLRQQPKVKAILTVEKELDCIELVAPFLANEIGYHCGDLQALIHLTRKGTFDFAFFDIWQSTGEWTWQTQVVPLRRLARNKIKKVLCWQENEMQGQIWQGVFRFASIPREELAGSASKAHWYVWRKAIEEQHGLEVKTFSVHDLHDFDKVMDIEQENRANQNIIDLAKVFVRPELPFWETLFGKAWDETLQWYPQNLN